jgi:hypothetical protein
MKRILSFSIILLVLLSLDGDFSQNDCVVKTPLGEAQSQLAEDSENVIQEFRETIKVSLSNGIRTRTGSAAYEAGQLIFEGIRQARYDSYLQNRLASNPSVKLFINFGILLI